MIDNKQLCINTYPFINSNYSIQKQSVDEHKTRRIINCVHVTSTVITLSATRNYTKLVIPFFYNLFI